MSYGYIAKLHEAVERTHVRYNNRYGIAIAAEPKELYIVEDAEHIDLYDRVDRIPFDKLEQFFREAL